MRYINLHFTLLYRSPGCNYQNAEWSSKFFHVESWHATKPTAFRKFRGISVYPSPPVDFMPAMIVVWRISNLVLLIITTPDTKAFHLDFQYSNLNTIAQDFVIFFPFPAVDIVWARMIVWRTRGNIIRTVLWCVMYDSCAQWYAHTHMSSSWRWVLV